jgi:hypothetical protein
VQNQEFFGSSIQPVKPAVQTNIQSIALSYAAKKAGKLCLPALFPLYRSER